MTTNNDSPAAPAESASPLSLKEVRQHFQERTLQLAAKMDYSGKDGKAILSDFVEAQTKLEELRRVTSEKPPRSPEIAWECAELASGLFAIILATSKVVFDRIKKNQANFNFGLLLMGSNEEMQAKAYTKLIRLSRRIAVNKGWGPPGGNWSDWESLANETLAKELAKYEDLAPMDVLERMIDNDFRYVAEAIADDIRDWFRVHYRQAEEQFSAGEVADPARPIDEVDQKIQREQVAGLFDKAASRYEATGQPGIAETLRQAARLLEDPERYGPNVGAEIIKAVVEARDISPQQAREYRSQVASLAKDDAELQKLIEELRRFEPIRHLEVRFQAIPEDSEPDSED